MSRMPFRWTVNPYRGCSHACSYCLAPSTPVLLADGTQRAIGELRVGDEIVGTAPTARTGATCAPASSTAGPPASAPTG